MMSQEERAVAACVAKRYGRWVAECEGQREAWVKMVGRHTDAAFIAGTMHGFYEALERRRWFSTALGMSDMITIAVLESVRRQVDDEMGQIIRSGESSLHLHACAKSRLSVLDQIRRDLDDDIAHLREAAAFDGRGPKIVPRSASAKGGSP